MPPPFTGFLLGKFLMSHVYVTSDWHLGHKGITNHFRKQFPSDHVHDGYIYDQAHQRLTKRDTLFCLGDMAFTYEGLDMIGCLPGRKILVRGNHDTFPTQDYLKVFDEVHGAYRYKGAFLTHIPIHPMELFRGYNVHGHCHRGGPRELQKDEEWQQYYNAILEFNDYQIIRWDRVMEKLTAPGKGQTVPGKGKKK